MCGVTEQDARAVVPGRAIHPDDVVDEQVVELLTASRTGAAAGTAAPHTRRRANRSPAAIAARTAGAVAEA